MAVEKRDGVQFRARLGGVLHPVQVSNTALKIQPTRVTFPSAARLDCSNSAEYIAQYGTKRAMHIRLVDSVIVLCRKCKQSVWRRRGAYQTRCGMSTPSQAGAAVLVIRAGP
jgi:hypothetical protein